MVENLKNWNGRTCRVVIRFDSDFFEWFRFFSFFWWWLLRGVWIRHSPFESISFIISGPFFVSSSWTDFTIPLGISELDVIRKWTLSGWFTADRSLSIWWTVHFQDPLTMTPTHGIDTILVIYSYTTLVLKCESDIYHVKISENFKTYFMMSKCQLLVRFEFYTHEPKLPEVCHFHLRKYLRTYWSKFTYVQIFVQKLNRMMMIAANVLQQRLQAVW